MVIIKPNISLIKIKLQYINLKTKKQNGVQYG